MIYALSSVPGALGSFGRVAIAVIRVSGEDSLVALQLLLREQSLPRLRQASLRRLYHPDSGVLLDRALVLCFRAPHSFTGEDTVELHVHGGRAVINAVMSALAAIPGSRYAGAGEFSRRAFAHAKLDITAAEGLADLINADTEAQRRLAIRQAEGEAYAVFEGWNRRLCKMLAHVEACLDFADEDLPSDIFAEAFSDASKLLSDMQYHLALGEKAERLRLGVRAAILGSTNVGKSSLLNYFAGREAAIVSHVAGTTRDVIEVSLELHGFPLLLSDTAGLRDDCEDIVESEGIRRAYAQAEMADMRLFMYDLSEMQLPPKLPEIYCDGDLLVFNKADRVGVEFMSELAQQLGACGFGDYKVISLLDGRGLEALQASLLARVKDLSEVEESPAVTRMRQRAALSECMRNLHAAVSADMADIAAEELRLALNALGEITGRTSSEDLLDVIFADFCIGK